MLKSEIQIDPELSAMSVIDLINAAQKIESEGRIGDSADLYRAWTAVHDGEQTFPAYFNLGILLMKCSALIEAEQSFRTAITLRWGFVNSHHMLCAILESTGRVEAARRHWFDVLLSAKPDSAGERELIQVAASRIRGFAESMEKLQFDWSSPSEVAAVPTEASELESHPPTILSDPILRNAPKDRRYVVVAPPFQNSSAGIRVLYELQKWLVRSGQDAIICTWFPGYPISQFEEDIVIYPEVAPGNLLKAKRVVRYILNVPGKLGHGEKTFAAGEQLVAYNRELASYSNGLILQVPAIESFFNSDLCCKTVDAVFVGKGKDLGLHPKNCIPITKNFPATRREMAALLRSVKTLYMYDDFSMISKEAQLCGCDVRLIRRDGIVTDYPFSVFPTEEEFQMQLRDFIAITKSL